MMTTILFALLLIFWLYRKTTNSANFPPGPFNLPIVGYMPFLKPPLYKHMALLSETYGDVLGLQFGSYRVIILSSIDAITSAFKQEAFSGRPDFPFFTIRSDNKKGITFSEGHNWREMRRFTLRNLRDFGFGKSNLEGLIHYEIRDLINGLQADAGKPVQLLNRFNLAIINALWTIIAGFRFSHDDPQAMMSVEASNKLLAAISNESPSDFMPFLSSFGRWKKDIANRLQTIQPALDHAIEMIKGHLKVHKEGEESDLIHSFLERMQTNNNPVSPFGEAGLLNLKNVVYDLFIAGTETTATSILWFILLLATYPEIQEKIHQEIDTHVPSDQMPSTEHRHKLTYTEATIFESMRFVTLSPMGLFHSTLSDTKFRNYDIPKGTIVFANLYQIHHDPKYWKKPYEFYPEHFLNLDGSLSTPEAFMPFAVGKRACLGESLARLEFYLFASALLQKFRFKFPIDRPKPSLEPKGTRVLSPQPFEVVIELRN